MPANVAPWRAERLAAALDRAPLWTLMEYWHAWKDEKRKTPWDPTENGYRLRGCDLDGDPISDAWLDLSWWQFEVVLRNFGHKVTWVGSAYSKKYRKFLEEALIEVDGRVARGEITPPAGNRTSWSGSPIHGTAMAPAASLTCPPDWSLPYLPVASRMGGKLGWEYVPGKHPEAEEWVVATS
jgi:hypothetical protein